MSKGTNSSKVEKGDIIAVKRVGKSPRGFSKALGRSKTVICNYLKCPNKYGTIKPTDKPEKILPQFKRRLFREVKIKKYLNIRIIDISIWFSLQY